MRVHDQVPATALLTPATPTRLPNHTALSQTKSPQEQAAQEQADQKKVSDGIESMFVRQMLEASHLFEGVGGHPMMQNMMMEKLADTVVQGGHLGIGDMVSRTQAESTALPRTVHGPTRSHATSPKDKDDDGMIGSVDEIALLQASTKPLSRGLPSPSSLDFGGLEPQMSMSIDVGDFALPDDLLPKAAQAAVNEGRVPGFSAGASFWDALHRSWTPAMGTPQGDTGVIALSQADSNETLGHGPKTIRQAGCLLTSMTMVSNALTGARNGVDAANRLVTAAGGFDGNNLQLPTAAQALGLKVASRSAFAGSTQALDASLAHGRPVVVGVDFKDGTSSSLGRTDHFLVVTGRAPGGGYTAIDSADGRPLTFGHDGQGGLRSGKYNVAEVVTLEPSTTTSPTTLAAAASRARAARWSMNDVLGSFDD
jgi:hypothetical protein